MKDISTAQLLMSTASTTMTTTASTTLTTTTPTPNMLTTPLLYEKYDDDLSKVISHKIKTTVAEDNYDAFYIGDLGDIVRKHKIWKALLPRVQPFYAVKCNDHADVLGILAKMGTGFDCASKGEIKQVLDLGVTPDRIVYANPCKQSSHIKYAARHNVQFMTFDNETELIKVKEHHPDAKLIVRILPPESKKCTSDLGLKFGCQPKHIPKLLQLAKHLELDVVGVSFHVGSGCYDKYAFSAAVESAYNVFNIARDQGFNFTLLDIGGGFPGQDNAKLSFNEIVDVLRPSLDTYFPEESGVQIIAEPGRFFAASAFTLAVSVIASRQVAPDVPADGQLGSGGSDVQQHQPKYMHYVNDGVYGSFNCILFDHAEVTASLPEPEKYIGKPEYQCSLWGPTCDGLDCIIKECRLPLLTTGDWLLFRDMGAYTMAAASCFNGMPKPKCFFVMQEMYMEVLNNLDNDGVNPYSLSASACGSGESGSSMLYPSSPTTNILSDFNFMKTGHSVDQTQMEVPLVPLEI